MTTSATSSTSLTSTAIELTLEAAGQALLEVTSSSVVSSIISSALAWVPVIVEDFPDLLDKVETFISIAVGSSDISDSDLAALQSARQQLEARRAAWKAANPDG